jgi:hypothetical protein
MSDAMTNEYTVEQLKSTFEVKRWLVSAKLDAQPESEQDSRIRVLAEFCNFQGRDPKVMIDEVLRGGEEDGQYTIAIKARRELDAAINRFGDTLGLSLHQNITAGNVVRSFFIHNGVQMQGRPSL